MAIIDAYIWNLPSHKNITIFLEFYLTYSLGDVQPNTYPPERGFYCGIMIFVYPFYISFCFVKKRELLNCIVDIKYIC